MEEHFDGVRGAPRQEAVAAGDSAGLAGGGGSAVGKATRATTGALDLARPMVAEFVGVFTLVFVGVGAITVSAPLGGLLSLVGVAFAHGLALGVMVSATAAVSGGHINPAVTFGALLAGKISPARAVGHWAAQVAGGIAAALVIGALLPHVMLLRAGYGVPVPAAFINPWTAMVIEFVLTFFLVFVVFGTAIDGRAPRVGGLFIGLTLVMGILIGGPLTGAALNPARFLGPAIVNASQLQDTWIYLVGPLLGGALAGLLWRFGLRLAPPPTA